MFWEQLLSGFLHLTPGNLLMMAVGGVLIYLAVRRLMIGPEAEGLFTLFGIAFFLIGITLFGIGLLGEYVARIYEQVRERPRYLVREVLEREMREPQV